MRDNLFDHINDNGEHCWQKGGKSSKQPEVEKSLTSPAICLTLPLLMR